MEAGHRHRNTTDTAEVPEVEAETDTEDGETSVEVLEHPQVEEMDTAPRPIQQLHPPTLTRQSHTALFPPPPDEGWPEDGSGESFAARLQKARFAVPPGYRPSRVHIGAARRAGARRRLGCGNSCFGYKCSQWWNKYSHLTCGTLESKYSCDCCGCSCESGFSSSKGACKPASTGPQCEEKACFGKDCHYWLDHRHVKPFAEHYFRMNALHWHSYGPDSHSC